MKIHKEGYIIILTAALILGGIYTLNHLYLKEFPILYWLITIKVLVLFYLVVQFFRVPKRTVKANENEVICPSDGKVVVIEEVEEPEFFKDKRIQVSIFMSPLNVHAQWNPISGKFAYTKYHPGKYLVAWHPKSSTENERTTLVIEDNKNRSVLVRQIAGAVARRIRYYVKDNDSAMKGEEFGFIKFGSRVDVFLPLGTKINVEIGQKVQGKSTILATLQD